MKWQISRQIFSHAPPKSVGGGGSWRMDQAAEGELGWSVEMRRAEEGEGQGEDAGWLGDERFCTGR